MHTKFHYHTLDDVVAEGGALGLRLPLSQETAPLAAPFSFGEYTLANRLCVQPMEGQDAEVSGAPSALTARRYLRFAAGGAAMIWFEAVAVCKEGMANPRQLRITEENLDAFKRLNDDIRKTALASGGPVPLLIAQLTHSGRYAKPQGSPRPMIAINNPSLEGEAALDAGCIVTDDYLQRLPEKYANAARLCHLAGFDGVDIKACHRYLFSELLCAHERPGPYGGTLENRFRALGEAVAAVQAKLGGKLLVTCRLNLYDGFPYPDGFGVSKESGLEPVLDESRQVVKWLHQDFGLPLLNFTIGNPYKNPHVNRPYDLGGYVPPEHPFVGLARMMHCVGEIKRAFPTLGVVGSGFSYLRQFSQNLAAGAVAEGVCDVAGFGRMAFAYPNFANDIVSGRGLTPGSCCVACGKCTEFMRAGSTSGCAVRDPFFTQQYKTDVLGRKQ